MPMTDVFATLRAVRAFLDSQVAAAVPAELRGDVRAAAKTLNDLAVEIDALPALLQVEIEAMLELQRSLDLAMAATPAGATATIEPALAAGLPATGSSLHEALTRHQQLSTRLAAMLVALQVQLRDTRLPAPARIALTQVALRSYRLFEQQAAARLTWQSTFDLATRKGSPTT